MKAEQCQVLNLVPLRSWVMIQDSSLWDITNNIMFLKKPDTHLNEHTTLPDVSNIPTYI